MIALTYFFAVALTTYFFPAVSLLIGIAGVAAYLTGTVRKGLAEAQKEIIATQDHQITTLQVENGTLRDTDRERAAALDVLVQQVRGVAELTQVSKDLARIQQSFEDRTARFDHIDHELDLIRKGVLRAAAAKRS